MGENHTYTDSGLILEQKSKEVVLRPPFLIFESNVRQLRAPSDFCFKWPRKLDYALLLIHTIPKHTTLYTRTHNKRTDDNGNQ